MNKAIFPGSFDPFTIGHADIVERGLRLFDEIIIAIGCNEHKSGWLPVEERMNALKQYYSTSLNVKVTCYSGLTVDFAREQEAGFILRGVRSVRDYEYEADLANINKSLSGIETVILLAAPDISVISSSAIRELHHFGRDITPWLPQGLAYESLKK